MSKCRLCSQYFSHVMKMFINNRNDNIPQTFGYFRKKCIYYCIHWGIYTIWTLFENM